jgi:hypothetical protein
LRSGHFGDVCGEFNYGVLDYSVLVKSIDWKSMTWKNVTSVVETIVLEGMSFILRDNIPEIKIARILSADFH